VRDPATPTVKETRAMSRRSIVLAFSLVWAVLACGAAFAQSGDAAATADNVLLTVRLGKVDGGKKTVEKTYEIVLSPGTEGSRLLSGARVPLPTSSEKAGADDDVVVAAFTYQNIGFSITADVQRARDGKVLLRALLEDSRVADEGPADGPPVVETRQLSVNVVLQDGKPLEITRVERLVGESGFVEVQADFLN